MKILPLGRVSQVKTCLDESVTAKFILDGQETSENINDTESGTKYASVEDQLNMHKSASNETTLISKIPNIINEKNVTVFFLQVSLAIMFFVIFQSVLHDTLFKSCCILSNTFHQMQIIYVFARSVYERHNLCSSKNFAIYKIIASALTSETVENNLKRETEVFVASDNAFSFISSMKRTSGHWKQFLHDVLAMVNYEYAHIS